MKDRYPNLTLTYLSTRIYAGYTLQVGNPEPYAYENGFSAKWLIEDQLNGVPELNYDPARGPVEASWIAWGPYLWADGLGPDGLVSGIPGRSDGLEWFCTDFASGGIHASSEGELKVAQMLIDFFKTDTTARKWFLARTRGGRRRRIPAPASGS